jgi:glycosyltransferase involved in cell wall biosynthesis
MKLLVFCDNYPRPGPGYADSFVRFRLESYLKAFSDAEIVVVKLIRNSSPADNYEFGGVRVEHHSRESLPALLASFKPDVMLAHFIQAHLCRVLPDLSDAPLLVWIHGEEALSWRRRLFYLKTLGLAGFLRYIASNYHQRAAMAHLFRRSNQAGGKIRFVFVSNWMREVAESDVGVTPKYSNIIANFVDDEFFAYRQKTGEMNKKFLLIRSFNSAKYANDLAVAAIEKLRVTYPRFNELEFTVVGSGKLWEPLTSRIRFDNVKLLNRSLDHNEIRELHASHGVFLCPTRQDAQGVSMCEAMSSGLVPIASKNTAIPEYLKPTEGYLCDSVDDMVEAMIELAEDDAQFLSKSGNAAHSMRQRTGYAATIQKEIELIHAATRERALHA